MIFIILLLVVLPITATMLQQRNLVIKLKQKTTANTLREIIVHKKPQTTTTAETANMAYFAPQTALVSRKPTIYQEVCRVNYDHLYKTLVSPYTRRFPGVAKFNSETYVYFMDKNMIKKKPLQIWQERFQSKPQQQWQLMCQSNNNNRYFANSGEIQTANITNFATQNQNKIWFLRNLHPNITPKFEEEYFFEYLAILPNYLSKSLSVTDFVTVNLAATTLTLIKKGYPPECVVLYQYLLFAHARNREDLAFLIPKIKNLATLKVNFYNYFSKDIREQLIPIYSQKLLLKNVTKVEEELACFYGSQRSHVPIVLCSEKFTCFGYNRTGQLNPDAFKWLTSLQKPHYFDVKNMIAYFNPDKTKSIISPYDHIRVCHTKNDIKLLAIAGHENLIRKIIVLAKVLPDDLVKKISDYKEDLETNLKLYEKTNNLDALVKKYWQLCDEHSQIIIDQQLTQNLPAMVSIEDLDRANCEEIENLFIGKFAAFMQPYSKTHVTAEEILNNNQRIPKKMLIFAVMEKLFPDLFS